MRHRHAQIFIHVKQRDLAPIDVGQLREFLQKQILRIAGRDNRSGRTTLRNRLAHDIGRIISRGRRHLGQRIETTHLQLINLVEIFRGVAHNKSIP